MKEYEKLAHEQYVEEGHDPGIYQGFLIGFKAAREMAAKQIKASVNLDGMSDPGNAIINRSLQARHDYMLCLKLGESEVT